MASRVRSVSGPWMKRIKACAAVTVLGARRTMKRYGFACPCLCMVVPP